MSSPDSPQFEVSVVPLTPDDITRVTEWICEDLEAIHIGDVQYTMKHGKRRPAAEQQSEGQSRGTMAGPWFEPRVAGEPLALIFHYHWNWTSLAVRMVPKNFDRTIPRQDALFQKVVAILEVLRDGPLRPKSTQFDCLTVRNFKFWRNKSAEEAQLWAHLVEAWKAHQ